MTIFLRSISLLLLTAAFGVQAAPPVVSNVRASQRPGTKLVDIYYDLADDDGDLQDIRVQVSSDGGKTFTIPAATFSGAYGPSVSPGMNRHIVWDAGADWAGNFVDNASIRVTAFDGTTHPAPPGMVFIQGGPYRMGDSYQEGDADELPSHNVTISGFFVDQTEITESQWLEVYSWSLGNGYSYLSPPTVTGGNMPVRNVTWIDAAIWCNARSAREGLPTFYLRFNSNNGSYYSLTFPVSRVHTRSYSGSTVKAYRLPTEAEWEKMARGGLSSKRYQNSDTITTLEAVFDLDLPQQVKSKLPNGFRVYDVLGNVSEWCNDVYKPTFYGESDGATDPANPAFNPGHTAWTGREVNSLFVHRGGNYSSQPSDLRISKREKHQGDAPNSSIGFRCVRLP